MHCACNHYMSGTWIVAALVCMLGCRGGGSAQVHPNLAAGANHHPTSLCGDPYLPVWDLEPIHFDFNCHSLRDDAIQILNDNAITIKDHIRSYIQIEGHCDARGSQDYNFALAEARALAVRDHLVKLGVDSSKLITISYGEEVPAVQGDDEFAHAQNRRVEFKLAR